jgi:3D (Asp-Asp-Asp) domain-containing protein
LIANDHRSASILTTGFLAFSLSLAASAVAQADPGDAAAAPLVLPAAPSASVSYESDGHSITITTQASNVGDFLTERQVRVSQGDFVSAPVEAPVVDGMKIEYRPARVFAVYIGKDKRVVHSAARSVRELLSDARIAFGPHDEVAPELDASLGRRNVVRITRVDMWTVRERSAVVPSERMRDDANLAIGKTRTIDAGATGLRETTVRLVRRNDGPIERIVLASRVIRAPRERLIARGIADYSELANVAERGFTSALHFARTALHMIATAYTAGCYGCSGITASGTRAGFGVIAVDPSVIPLGTKLFIPGYGRAVAGDTGGAIHGHRVDLGMDTVSEAMRFGRRAVTVYVLR